MLNLPKPKLSYSAFLEWLLRWVKPALARKFAHRQFANQWGIGPSGCHRSAAVAFVAKQFEELRPSAGVIAEGTEHGRSNGVGVLLFDATHHHAKVLRLDNHANPFRPNEFHEGTCDLLGHSLLDLQTARVNIHKARILERPTIFFVGR